MHISRKERMKNPICDFCGEYKNCTCTWETCALCGERYSNYDPDENHQIFEYRGVLGCSKCIDEVREKRDYQRQQIIETQDKMIRSQADGEWSNGGYKTMKTDMSGRPMTKIREPLSVKNYEDGIL